MLIRTTTVLLPYYYSHFYSHNHLKIQSAWNSGVPGRFRDGVTHCNIMTWTTTESWRQRSWRFPLRNSPCSNMKSVPKKWKKEGRRNGSRRQGGREKVPRFQWCRGAGACIFSSHCGISRGSDHPSSFRGRGRLQSMVGWIDSWS